MHSVDLLACRCLGDGGDHLVSWRNEWSASGGLSPRVRVTTVVFVQAMFPVHKQPLSRSPGCFSIVKLLLFHGNSLV